MTGIHQLLFSNFPAGGVPTGEAQLNASGGNETQTIGIYKYHVFTSSGVLLKFSVEKAKTVSSLIPKFIHFKTVFFRVLAPFL